MCRCGLSCHLSTYMNLLIHSSLLQIYFPAIKALSDAFKVSIEAINLTGMATILTI